MSDSPMEYTSKDRGRTPKPIFVLACTSCVQRQHFIGKVNGRWVTLVQHDSPCIIGISNSEEPKSYSDLISRPHRAWLIGREIEALGTNK